MTRNQAIEIARQRALNTRESHGYLPVTEADAQTWMPHEWVIDAILLATMQCDLAAQQPCQYCNDTGDVHGLDGEWQGTCTACKWGAARPAAQPVALTVDEKAALDRALLRSVKIVDEAAQPVAWLVESEPGGLWWDGRFVSRGIDPRFFTRDPNEAIRFARREDAEKVASSSSALKATEHMWIAAQPQQATEGSRLSDLRGLLADAQPKQPNGQA